MGENIPDLRFLDFRFPIRNTRSSNFNSRSSRVALGLLLFTVLAQPCHGQTTEKEEVAPKRLLFVTNEAFGKKFSSPMGVYFDTHHDEILIADTGNHRVVVLDGSDGRAKAEFIHRVKQPDGKVILGDPRSIAQDSAGNIFVVDSLCDYVEICDFRGGSVSKLRLKDYPLPGESPSEVSDADLKPVAVTVDFQDNLYVASPCHIFVFDTERRFQKRLGRKGQGPYEFIAITSLWVDTAGKIYVTDAMGYGIRVLSPEGKVLFGFGQHESGFDNFSLPIGVVTDRRGYLWVADTLRHVVTIYDATGKFLDYIGSYGPRLGQFSYPSGVAAHWGGKIAVVERVGGRVQCFELAKTSKSEMTQASHQ